MRARACVGLALLAGFAVVAASCSTSPSGQNAATSSTVTSTSSPTGAGSSQPTSAPSGSSARNLPITNSIRAQLVAAGAGLNNIPVAQYSGLAPGLTYYALDAKTKVHWAAARLQPASTPDRSSPSQAQVASQDAGSYYVFQQSPGGSWTAYAAGNTGPSTPCPVTIPASVLRAWGWPVGSCRPNGV